MASTIDTIVHAMQGSFDLPDRDREEPLAGRAELAGVLATVPEG